MLTSPRSHLCFDTWGAHTNAYLYNTANNLLLKNVLNEIQLIVMSCHGELLFLVGDRTDISSAPLKSLCVFFWYGSRPQTCKKVSLSLTHTPIPPHPITHFPSLSLALSHTHLRAHTLAHTYTCTHAHTHTDTHTHTHTHTLRIFVGHF